MCAVCWSFTRAYTLCTWNAFFFFCFKILLLSLVSFFDVMLSNVICVNGSMKGVRVYALAFLCRYSIIYIIKCMCVDIVFCLLSFGYVYKNNIQARKKKTRNKTKVTMPHKSNGRSKTRNEYGSFCFCFFFFIFFVCCFFLLLSFFGNFHALEFVRWRQQ